MIYYNIKSNWRINKAYKYNPEFEKVIPAAKSGFLFFSFRYLYKIKSSF